MGFEPSGVPVTIVGDRHWIGWSDAVRDEIEAILELEDPGSRERRRLGQDLVGRRAPLRRRDRQQRLAGLLHPGDRFRRRREPLLAVGDLRAAGDRGAVGQPAAGLRDRPDVPLRHRRDVRPLHGRHLLGHGGDRSPRPDPGRRRGRGRPLRRGQHQGLLRLQEGHLLHDQGLLQAGHLQADARRRAERGAAARRSARHRRPRRRGLAAGDPLHRRVPGAVDRAAAGQRRRHRRRPPACSASTCCRSCSTS